MQVCQRPVLAHLGPDSLVETDAVVEEEEEGELVEYWRGYLRKTSTYNSWWQDRLLDAKVLLGDNTFSYSRLYTVILLNGLHSLCILLCEHDNVHDQLARHDQYNAFCAALRQVVVADLGALTHPDHEMDSDEAKPRTVIQNGVSEGIRLVTHVRASAPSRDVVYTDTVTV